MKKFVRFSIKLFLSVQLLMMVSCGDDFALTEKYYYVAEKNKEWLVKDSLTEPYEMVDNNGNAYNFTEVSVQKDFSEGTSGILFLTTKKSFRENYYLSSATKCGASFSMYLYASYGDGCDDVMYLSMDNVTIHFDLTSYVIDYFGCRLNNVKWTQTDENSRNSVFVKAEFLDSINVRNHVYKGVLWCRLRDNINVLDDTDIKDVFYAQGIGLIKYILKSDIVVERKPK